MRIKSAPLLIMVKPWAANRQLTVKDQQADCRARLHNPGRLGADENTGCQVLDQGPKHCTARLDQAPMRGSAVLRAISHTFMASAVAPPRVLSTCIQHLLGNQPEPLRQ
jgi:hypothetical protein